VRGTDSKFDPYRVRVHGAMRRLGPEVTNSDIASHRLSGGDRSREKHAPNPKSICWKVRRGSLRNNRLGLAISLAHYLSLSSIAATGQGGNAEPPASAFSTTGVEQVGSGKTLTVNSKSPVTGPDLTFTNCADTGCENEAGIGCVGLTHLNTSPLQSIVELQVALV
jgi:hypothetical protein